MVPSSQDSDRRYSFDEASAMLPWLRRVVGDMVRLAAVIGVRRPLLEGLSKSISSPNLLWFSEEVEASLAALNADSEQLRAYVSELSMAGIRVRNLGEGLLEIPGLRGGRGVVFSWCHGEPEIAYWREENEDPTLRRPWDPATRNRLSVSARPAIESS